MESSANNFRKKQDKCGATINNGEPGALSELSLIKYHPLKNNSFTPQPGSHLAHAHTRTHTYTHTRTHTHTVNKCVSTPTCTLANTQQRVKRHHCISTGSLLLPSETHH